MSNRSHLLNIIFCIPCVFFYCTSHPGGTATETFTLERDSMVTIVESGELESINNTFIYTPSNWHMTYRIIYLVPEGSYVQQGDTVVMFDTEEAVSKLEEAQATLELKLAKLSETLEKNSIALKEKRNAVKQLEIQNEINKNKLQQARFESDVNRKKMELELEKSKLNLKKSKADLESQKILNQKDENLVRLEIRQARVEIERARNALSDLYLVAPKGGMVVYKRQGWGDDGEKVREGDTVWPRSAILAIPDLSTMRVLVKLNEVDRPVLNEGLKAHINVEAYPDTVFHGEVEFVSRIVNWTDDSNNLKTYDVGVKIYSGENFRLKPGLSAQVTIGLNRVKQAYRVPSTCLFGEEENHFIRTKDQGDIPVSLIEIRDGLAFIDGADLKSGLQVFSNLEIPKY